MVVATIHGLDVVAALDRLLTWARELEGEAASRNLENSLLAVIHQDLSSEDGKRRLRCPEFLLVPFKPEFKGIRAKLKDGNLNDLRNDMREQKNRITYKGLEGFL
jgi:twitching motility protein PilT